MGLKKGVWKEIKPFGKIYTPVHYTKKPKKQGFQKKAVWKEIKPFGKIYNPVHYYPTFLESLGLLYNYSQGPRPQRGTRQDFKSVGTRGEVAIDHPILNSYKKPSATSIFI